MARNKTHGLSYTKEYRCWCALKNRCLNKKNAQYSDYGGRGITISEDWLKFENFIKDMGVCPEDHEIDRIDNNKGYSKDNCRWTTTKVNSRNRRSTKIHKLDHEKLVQQDLIEKIGWSKSQFRWYRDRYGIEWILEGYKSGTLPIKTNKTVDRDGLIGKRMGRWTVLKYISYKRCVGYTYLCRCECGLEKNVNGYYLRSGKSTQCRKCSHKNQKIKPHEGKEI
jgi:hypothetical protein